MKGRISLRVHRQWQPDIDVFTDTDPSKFLLHHAYNCEGKVVEVNDSPNDVWIRAEPPFPQRVADHGHRVCARCPVVVFRRKCSPRVLASSESLKVIA